MGEEDKDVVNMPRTARPARRISAINFLHSIDGNHGKVEPAHTRYCLKALALFRFVLRDREIRIAGGRELHLGSMQCLGLYAANSLLSATISPPKVSRRKPTIG